MAARKDNKGRALRKGETYRKSDGLYMYKYTDPFGKKCYLYAGDLGVLREKEAQVKKDQLDGLDIYMMGKATVNFVFDRYIRFKTELRKTTYSNYVYTYDHYVRKIFGERKIAQVKYSDVLQFYTYLLEEEEISLSTLDSVHTVLHPAFDFAVRDEIIRNNPSDGVMKQLKKKFRDDSGVRHALTLEQQKAFMEALDDPRNLRWRPIFTAMLGTGCRVGEMIGLRWEDIDLDERMIEINHNVSYYARREGSYKCEFEVGLPKTDAGIRRIPMLETVYEAFMDEKKIQSDLGIECTSVIDGMSGFIFCNRYGSIHNPQALNRAIKRISDDYNSKEELRAKKEHRDPVMIPHFSNHVLRHTFCARFCENETNIKVIQTVMGHKDIQTTMDIYAEVNEQTKKESFEKLAGNLDIFRSGKGSTSK